MQLGNKEKDIGAFWRDPSAGFLLFLLQPGKGSNLYMVLLPREAHWRVSTHAPSSGLPEGKLVFTTNHIVCRQSLGTVNQLLGDGGRPGFPMPAKG